MLYQQINLADHTLVGQPCPEPDNLRGLSNEILADIGRYIVPAPPGMEGQGWWPVIVTPPSSLDPKSQVVTDPTSYTVDVGAQTVTGQQGVRAMTADEFAVANPVPASISRRQFYQQLAVQSIITQDEAVAVLGAGTIPAAIQSLIGRLPQPQQFPAVCLLVGASDFQRQHPLTLTFAGLFGWDAPTTDTFWRAASEL